MIFVGDLSLIEPAPSPDIPADAEMGYISMNPKAARKITNEHGGIAYELMGLGIHHAWEDHEDDMEDELNDQKITREEQKSKEKRKLEDESKQHRVTTEREREENKIEEERKIPGAFKTPSATTTLEEEKREKETDLAVESDKQSKESKQKPKEYDFYAERFRYLRKAERIHQQLQNFKQTVETRILEKINEHAWPKHCKMNSTVFEVIDLAASYRIKMHFAYCEGKIFVNGVHKRELGTKMYKSAGVLNSHTLIVDGRRISIPHRSEAVEEAIPQENTESAATASGIHWVLSYLYSYLPISESVQVEEEKSLEYARASLEKENEKLMTSILEKLKSTDGNLSECTLALGRFYHRFEGYTAKYHIHVALCNNVIFINAEPHKNLGPHWDGEFGFTLDGHVLINDKKYIRVFAYSSMMG